MALLVAPFIWCPLLRADTSAAFAYPPELEPDVRFWIRVYTEVTTDGGLLHDDWYLGLVYEVLRFDPSDSPRQREHLVEQAKARYAALLRRFAAGDTENLTPHERRILHAFGDKTTPAQYREAIERIRFQLGQADRFHEGLIRAQAYEASISRVLADRGVPRKSARCRTSNRRSTRPPIRAWAPPACGNSCRARHGAICGSTAWWISAWIRTAPLRPPPT